MISKHMNLPSLKLSQLQSWDGNPTTHLLAFDPIVRLSVLFCFKNSLPQTLRCDILEKHTRKENSTSRTTRFPWNGRC